MDALLFGGRWNGDTAHHRDLVGKAAVEDRIFKNNARRRQVDFAEAWNRENETDPGRSFGVHKIATVLREEAEMDVEVFDFITAFTLDELKTIADNRITKSTKFVGFGVFSNPLGGEHVLGPIKEFISWIKKEFPWVVTVAGGQQYESTTEVYDTEYHIIGFGESAVLHFTQFIQGKGQILNWSTNEKGHKILLANTHHPAFQRESLAIKYEERDFIKSEEFLHLEYGRGCKFNCTFCSIPKRGVKEDYTRSAESLRKELLDNYNRWGTTQYLVGDETINDATWKLKKFGDVFAEMPFEPYTTGFIRADLLSARPEDYPHMLNMGLKGHFYGIESFQKEAARFAKKACNMERMQDFLPRMKEVFGGSTGKDFRGTISLILGLPGETKASIDHMFDWLVQNWSGHSVSIYPLMITGKEAVVYGNNSDLSNNYEKYGYRYLTELSDDSWIENRYPERFANFVKDWRDSGFVGWYRIPWARDGADIPEDQRFNFFDMMGFMHQFTMMWSEHEGVNSWGLYRFGAGHKLKPHEVADFRGPGEALPNPVKTGDFIREYKHNKMYGMT